MAAALGGAVVGALVVLSIEGATRSGPVPDRSSRPRPAYSSQAEDEHARTVPRRTTFLAWSPSGLGSGLARSVERARGVQRATLVRAGLDWLRSSRTPDGARLDAPPDGFAIPLELAVVRPRRYASFVPPADRAAVLSLRPGQLLLARTEARLRGFGEGLQMSLRSGTRVVAGVVSDAATSGYEAIGRGPVPRTWGTVDEFVLATAKPSARRAIARRVRSSLPPGAPLRIRRETETPFLRYGDAVLPQLLIKHVFGEFAARPNADGSIEVEPGWKRRNIATRRVPILGRATCHRSLFAQLRSALRELVSAGHSHLLDPGQFAGCFSPRFVDARPGGRLSHHSWGIAFDVNVADNGRGARPELDPRVVETFERAGFTWGGRWLIPDGMHFEWVRFP